MVFVAGCRQKPVEKLWLAAVKRAENAFVFKHAKVGNNIYKFLPEIPALFPAVFL